MQHPGLLAFDGTEELDLVGPYEVFAAAAELGGLPHPLVVAERLGPIRCAKGLSILPQVTYDDCPPLDLLLIPGGDGRRAQMTHAPTLDFVRRRAPTLRHRASVCTGAFVWVAAGLADGKRMTTHHSRTDELATFQVEVVRGVRFVSDGDLVSSAGVSAGIDMALWLVAQRQGRDFAEAVRQYIEYDHPLLDPA
jgi:transcriptional regulator GlxA family with amidase domain